MIIGPKYKICKRLGSPIFEKCQTRSFALSQERTGVKKKGGRAPSDYSRQLIEKQKLRLTYGLSEKQFGNYVEKALESRVPQATLFALLESRIDSIAYRMGFAKTRRQARQMASHGHLTVNGRKITVPSYQISVNDVIGMREGSRDSGLFAGLPEKLKEFNAPNWIALDIGTNEGKLSAVPALTENDAAADIGAVFEYYTR
jgi:small subunit ribosomal protein S4